MPATSKGLRYPASSAAPNVPQDIQNLATDVNTALPNAWVTLAVSDSTYQYAPTSANQWQNLTGFALNTASVPAGRTLDVEFSAPTVNAGDAFVYVKLVIAGVDSDAGIYSVTWSPVKLTGSYVPAGAGPIAIACQIQKTGTTGDLRAGPIGVVRLRYRIV